MFSESATFARTLYLQIIEITLATTTRPTAATTTAAILRQIVHGITGVVHTARCVWPSPCVTAWTDQMATLT